MTCCCDLNCVNQPQEHQGALHAIKQNVEHVLSSVPTPALLTLSSRWTSRSSSTDNCLTYNTVYVIHCSKCAQPYTSETGRTLDTRFKEHFADSKHWRDKPVHRRGKPITPTKLTTPATPSAWKDRSFSLQTVWMTQKTWNHTWLINTAAENQVEWMKDLSPPPLQNLQIVCLYHTK